MKAAFGRLPYGTALVALRVKPIFVVFSKADHRLSQVQPRRSEMSYSFNVAAASKEGAKQKIAEQFDCVEISQPVHKADRAAAQAAAYAFVDVLADPAEGEEIHVSVHGSVGWREEGKFTHSNAGVSASRQPVKVAA